jgi:translation initiation factor IF-2
MARQRVVALLIRGWRARLSSATEQQHYHQSNEALAPSLLLFPRGATTSSPLAALGGAIARRQAGPPQQQRHRLLSTSASAHQKPNEKQHQQQQQQARNTKQQQPAAASLPSLTDLLGGRGGGDKAAAAGGGNTNGSKKPLPHQQQPRATKGGSRGGNQWRDTRTQRLADQKQRERDVQHARTLAEETTALLAERLRETEGGGGGNGPRGGGGNNGGSSGGHHGNGGRRAAKPAAGGRGGGSHANRRASPKELAERRKREAAALRTQTRAAAAQQAAGRWASRLEQLQQQQQGGQGQPVSAAAAAEASSAEDDAEEKGDRDGAQGQQQQHQQSQLSQLLREVVLSARDLSGGHLTARRLAALLGCSAAKVERCLADLGEPVRSDEDPVALDAAELAALELGAALILPAQDEGGGGSGGGGGDPGSASSSSSSSSSAPLEILEPRPPVVTVMGHVDHGKTSLLDALRRTDVAGGEAGGITQRIGAFSVDLPGSSRRLTFLDTPGHAAFGAMRARGAAVTDVVVLVVAADDGVMPQTAEALAHARAAGCPVVVAITKCDLVPSSRIEQVKVQLAGELGLELEAFGGTVQCVETAVVPPGKRREKNKSSQAEEEAEEGGGARGLRELEEALLLQAEVMELKAARWQRVGGGGGGGGGASASAAEGGGDKDCGFFKMARVRASGTVVEAHVERGMGPVATVVVQRGELRVGDVVVCGTAFGRVRALRGGSSNTGGGGSGSSSNSADVSVGPGEHALVSGLRALPSAGDELAVVADEDRAARIARARQARAQEYGRVALARARHSAEARRRAAAAAEAARKKALSARLNELRGIKRHQVGELKKALADFAALRKSQGGGGAAGAGSGAAASAAAAADADAADRDGGAQSSNNQDDEEEDDADANEENDKQQEEGPLPDAPVVPFIIKADVQGSAEAVRDAVLALPRRGTAAASVVLCGVGPPSLSDAHLAAATGARLLAFGVRPPSGDVEAAIRGARVRVLEHDVIYRLLDDVRELLEQEGAAAASGSGGDGGAALGGAFGGSSSSSQAGEREVVVGSGTVLQTFPLLRKGKSVGTVAGLGVDSGALVRSDAAGSAAAAAAAAAALAASSSSSSSAGGKSGGGGNSLPPGVQVVRVEYRVLRDGEVVASGLPCSDLRRQKLDVESVGKGAQCGAALDGGAWGGGGGSAGGGPKPGDVLECVAVVRSSSSQ